jgi:chromosome segregation ATPase
MSIFGMFKSKEEVIEDLRNEIEMLKRDKYILSRKLVGAADARNEADVRLEAEKVDFKLEASQYLLDHKLVLNELENDHKIEVSDLKNTIKRLEEEVPLAVDNAVIDAQNRYVDLENQLEERYNKMFKTLQSDLEDAKSHYRKNLKSEYKDKIDSLEKSNKSLTESNIKLTSELKASAHMQGVLEGQVESLQSVVESLVGALPEVSANITTPDVTVSNAGNNGHIKG